MEVGHPFNMKIKKIIFIYNVPISDKIIEDFYFNELLKGGFLIEYWDVSKIFFSKTLNQDKLKHNYIKKFKSIKDFKIEVSKQLKEETLFNPLLTYNNILSLRLFRILTKYKCQTSFIAKGALPGPSSELKNAFKLIISNNFFTVVNKTITYLKNKILYVLKKLSFVKHYDFIFCSGKNGIVNLGVGYKIDNLNSKLVQINSSDYDKFIENKSDLKINHKYCVFLDEYLPFHPDWSLLNFKTVDPIEYYNTMNSFFNMIENNGLKVIIAAHPKSDYKINPFEGREIYKYKTNELVKNSAFTMAHMSSSINYSILHNKKVLLLITDAYKKIYKNTAYRTSQYFSSALGEQLINCNDYGYIDISNTNIDQNLYLKYKYDYLTSKESESLKSSDLIINFLKGTKTKLL